MVVMGMVKVSLTHSISFTGMSYASGAFHLFRLSSFLFTSEGVTGVT